MARRNYGPIGCAASVLLLALLTAALIWMAEGRMNSGPPKDQITKATESLMRRTLLDRQIETLIITSLHPRRERWAWSVSRWAVQGELAYTDEGGRVEDSFFAVVRTVCDQYDDQKCWMLNKLSVAGESWGEK